MHMYIPHMGVVVADEEDEVLLNDGSLVPFPALLMIYEVLSLHPLPTHGKTQREDQGHQTFNEDSSL